MQGGQVDGKFIYSAFLHVNSEARSRSPRQEVVEGQWQVKLSSGRSKKCLVWFVAHDMVNRTVLSEIRYLYNWN